MPETNKTKAVHYYAKDRWPTYNFEKKKTIAFTEYQIVRKTKSSSQDVAIVT